MIAIQKNELCDHDEIMKYFCYMGQFLSNFLFHKQESSQRLFEAVAISPLNLVSVKPVVKSQKEGRKKLPPL